MRWRSVIVVGVSLGLVASACVAVAGDDDDDEPPLAGERVTIIGPELADELRSLQDAFAPFEEDTGITVVVAGSPRFEEEIGNRIAQGTPPDIAMFPQPGRMQDFADEIVPLPAEVAALVDDHTEAREMLGLVAAGDDLLGVPVAIDLKSLVWYRPAAFAAHGYEIPQTLDEFEALAEQMAEDGNVPFCLGLESGVATGWPFTDWIEEYLLRLEGPEVYDAWHRHEIAFDDPRVVAVAQHVYDVLARDGFVFGGLEDSATRSVLEAGLPMLDGDCMMYRLANFYAVSWPIGTEIGPTGDVDVFRLPGTSAYPNATLTGGTFATAFSDRRAVRATMEYLAGTEFAETRASNRYGYLSPNLDLPSEVYPNEIDRRSSRILADADPVRYDASDLMPGVVGSDAFWDAVVAISRGEMSVPEAFAAIERNWP